MRVLDEVNKRKRTLRIIIILCACALALHNIVERCYSTAVTRRIGGTYISARGVREDPRRHVRDGLLAVRTETTSVVRTGARRVRRGATQPRRCRRRRSARALRRTRPGTYTIGPPHAPPTYARANVTSPPPLTCYYFCYTVRRAYYIMLYRFAELYSLTTETAVTCVSPSPLTNTYMAVYICTSIYGEWVCFCARVCVGGCGCVALFPKAAESCGL